VLVTGASGFLGASCLDLLTRRDVEVHAASRRAMAGEAHVHWHSADLLDAARRRELMEVVQPTHLLHLAWYAEPGRFWDSELNNDWLSATLDLARLFGNVGGRRAVGVGSGAEYAPEGGVVREEAIGGLPLSLYGRAKLAAGIGFQVAAECSGYSSAWCRVFVPYGPGEPREKLMSYAIRTFLEGGVPQCGDLSRVRDFLFVDDVASALVHLVFSDGGGAFNVCSGCPVTLREILLRICCAVGAEWRVDTDARRVRIDDPLVLVGDNSRLMATGGWSPRTKLNEGIARCVASLAETGAGRGLSSHSGRTK